MSRGTKRRFGEDIGVLAFLLALFLCLTALVLAMLQGGPSQPARPGVRSRGGCLRAARRGAADGNGPGLAGSRRPGRQIRVVPGGWHGVHDVGLPEALLESELFGHERGAFTGAERCKPGMFELAAGGTLFLDEIGEMPRPLQVKLLRVLQDRRIQRLGAAESIPVDARIIAATNRDLASRVREGAFREDLFWRLNVIHLEVPPLRERVEDIPFIVGRLIARMNAKLGRAVRTVETEALRSSSARPSSRPSAAGKAIGLGPPRSSASPGARF